MGLQFNASANRPKKDAPSESLPTMDESISKATKPTDSPIKPKHLKNVVFLSFTDDGIRQFWNYMSEIKSKSLAYWKYFQLFHSILQANHTTVVEESLHFKGVFEQKGYYWSTTDTKTPYGALLKSYCNVLCRKLEFHYNNPNIPGGMAVDDVAFNLMINNAGVEFLYARALRKNMLTETLKLWQTIKVFLLEFLDFLHPNFSALTNAELESFQCKFQPFLLCVEETKYLYKYSRTILYKLQSDFPNVNAQNSDLAFMRLYQDQYFICSKVIHVEWISSNTDLEFIKNQTPPQFFQTRETQEAARSVVQETSSSTGVSRTFSMPANPRSSHFVPVRGQPTLLEAVVPPRLPTHNTQSIHDEMPIHKANKVNTSTESTAQNTNHFQERISILQSKLHDLELEKRDASREVLNLIEMNNEMALTNENLSSENARLQEELKQLKINSGRQFCQLYAAIRQRDERLKELDTSSSSC